MRQVILVPVALLVAVAAFAIWQMQTDPAPLLETPPAVSPWRDAGSPPAPLTVPTPDAPATPTTEPVREAEEPAPGPRTLQIEVVAAESARPLANASIRPAFGDPRQVFTDARGIVSLPAPPMDRDAYISVEADGFVQRGLNFSPSLPSIQVALWPGTEVRGVVRDAGSLEPVADAEVHLAQFWDGGNVNYRHLKTDAAGLFHVSPVRPDLEFRVDVEAKGYGEYREKFTWSPGAAPLDVRIGTGGLVLGQVLDPSGTAAAHVRVWIESVWIDSEFLDLRSDDDGRFRFSGLSYQAPMVVRAEREDGTRADSETFTLTEQDPERSVELRLSTGGLAILVELREADGRPVEGMDVKARGIRPRTESGLPSVEPAALHWHDEQVSDAAGRVTLHPPTAGWYRVYTYGSRPELSQEIDLEPGASETVILQWPGMGEVRGRVLNEHGNGAPVTRLTYRTDGPPALQMKTSTDAQGNFSLKGLPDAPGVLWVGPEYFYDNLGLGSRHLGQQLAPVKPGDDELLIRLTPPTRIRGRVTPLPEDRNLEVTVRSGEYERSGRSRLSPTGEFEVTIGRPVVTLDLVLSIPGAMALIREGMTVTPGGLIDLGDLEPIAGHRLTGQVVDHEQRPVPGASIDCTVRGLLELGVQADEQGRFEFEDLPAGPVRLRGSAEGHASITTDHPAGTETAVLVLPRQGTLRYTLVGGDAADDLQILVGSDRLRLRPSPQPQFVDLDPGEHTVRIHRPGDKDWSTLETIRIDPGQVTELEIHHPR